MRKPNPDSAPTFQDSRDDLLSVFAHLARHRRSYALAMTVVLSAVSYGVALFLGTRQSPAALLDLFAATAAVPVSLRLGADLLAGLSHQRWRYAGMGDAIRVVYATAGASAAFGIVLATPIVQGVGIRVLILDFLLATFTIVGVRVLYRILYERLRSSAVESGPDRKEQHRVLIVGAGEAGYRVGRELDQYPEYGYRLVGFVDDDPDKRGARIRGFPVLGSTYHLPELVEEHEIDGLIIAIPSASPAQFRELVARCDGCGVSISILPPAREILEEGDVRLGQLREIQIGDLLAREPVDLSLPELRADLRGESVLVTGAGGSIGAELARQVARHGPDRLVLFDQAESDLYFLERELEDGEASSCEVVAIVGDILDRARLDRIFTEHAPTRVYHAAAYKHVPLMETNPDEAVRNNVVGTWRVVQTAGQNGAEKFVLVSTDKAVEPHNVMGASKRMAELLVLAAQKRFSGTAFTAVRFGNVLGSQGSVIPLFRRQIASGGPVTVTHPQASRFFMTIPEAVQLILQASLLEEARGRITMLDMGEPVRILELARNMLRIAGHNGELEDQIEIIGLRPGEKLHEKLVGSEERAVDTEVEKIRVVESDRPGASIRFSGVIEAVNHLEELLEQGDGRRSRLVEEVWRWCGSREGEGTEALAAPTAVEG